MMTPSGIVFQRAGPAATRETPFKVVTCKRPPSMPMPGTLSGGRASGLGSSVHVFCGKSFVPTGPNPTP